MVQTARRLVVLGGLMAVVAVATSAVAASFLSRTGVDRPFLESAWIAGLSALLVGSVTLLAMRTIGLSVVRVAEQAQAEALELRNELDLLLQATGAAVSIKDEDGRFTVANRAFLERYGFTEEQVLGQTVFDLFEPGVADELATWDREARQSEGAFEIQEQIDAPDGPRTVISSRTALRDAEGRVRGVCAVSTDITALRAAQTQHNELGKLLEESRNEVYIFDAETLAARLINRGARANLGCSEEQALELTALDILAWKSEKDLRDLFGQLSAESISFEADHRRLDGTVYPVEAVAQRHTWTERPAFVIMAWDLTERRRNEIVTERVSRALRMLLQTDAAIADAPDEERLLGQLCEILSEAGGYHSAWVALRADDDRITSVAAGGNGADRWRRIELDLEDEQGAYGATVRAIRTGMVLVIREIHSAGQPALRKLAHTFGFSSLAALPLVIDEGAVGALTINSSDATGFADEELTLLQNLAGDIAHGLRSLRSQRETHEAQAQVQKLSHAIEQSHASILITDTAGKIEYVNPAFSAVSGYSAEEALGQNPRLLKSGKMSADLYADLWQTITSGREWFGELLNRKKSGELFWEQATISPVTDDSGRIISFIAIKDDISHSKRLQEELGRQLDRLRTLRSIDLAISSTFDTQLVLDTLIQEITGSLGFDGAAILLIEPDHGLRLARCVGLELEQPEPRLAPGVGLAGRAVLERRPIALPNPAAAGGQAFRASPHLAGAQLAFYIAVPLIAKGRPGGVLEVYTRERIPDADELEFLEGIGLQAAIAIEDSRAFERSERATIELSRAYDQTLEGWVHALDVRHEETKGHTLRVMETTLVLARAIGFDEEQLVHLRRGALLHDIGKLGIPDSILLKEGPLTAEERAVIEQHPVFAFQWLAPIEYLRPAIDIPYCHHERWDGTGYPRRLKGPEIPLAARVFAVVDVWDALSSDRSYRPAWPADRVHEHIASSAGSHFDPQIVAGFQELDL